MRSIVLAFLLLSARGAAATLAAWCVCKLLRRAHAPSRFLCWLWLAVGLRFVLPWGIPLRLPRPQNEQFATAAECRSWASCRCSPLRPPRRLPPRRCRGTPG